LKKARNLVDSAPQKQNMQPSITIQDQEHMALEDGCLHEFKKKFVVGTLRCLRGVGSKSDLAIL
jgi:hypothetical protein